MSSSEQIQALSIKKMQIHYKKSLYNFEIKRSRNTRRYLRALTMRCRIENKEFRNLESIWKNKAAKHWRKSRKLSMRNSKYNALDPLGCWALKYSKPILAKISGQMLKNNMLSKEPFCLNSMRLRFSGLKIDS